MKLVERWHSLTGRRARQQSEKDYWLFENIPDAFCILDAQWRFCYANWKFEHLLGRSREELRGRDFFTELPEARDAGCIPDFARALAEKTPLHLEKFFQGRETWFEMHGYPAEERLWLTLRDVSDRKWAEESLRNSSAFAKAILESVREGIVVFDREGRCRVWNRYMEELCDLPSEEAVGKAAFDLFGEEIARRIASLLPRALAGGTVHSGSMRLTRSGTQRSITATLSPQRSAGHAVIGAVAVVSDVTERVEAEERLRHAAFHDPLTGLPNRSFFMEKLQRSLERAGRSRNYSFAVLFMDLDRFKAINDSLGHLVGDALLIEVARRLEQCVRPEDIVARMGGDEFAVLLYQVQDEFEAARIARRITEKMATPVVHEDRELYTGASVGVAMASGMGHNAEDLIRNADTALYHAKSEGRGRVEIFGGSLHEATVALLQLELDLRRAVEDEQFEVYYQPIVALEDLRLVGFEALIRWNHPTRGRVSPVEFIPVAEDTGLILPIGRWVLETTCKQLVAWKEELTAARDLSIHVNLSGKHFFGSEVVSEIVGIVTGCGLDQGDVTLEVTESTILEKADMVSKVLTDLRAGGVTLSIDDFGTGYSSLQYLHRFPFDHLKVAQQFVRDDGERGSNLEILRAIVVLAHSLNMSVIAEGVETAKELEYLRLLGCEFGQGYLFARPLPAAEAQALIARDVAFAAS